MVVFENKKYLQDLSLGHFYTHEWKKYDQRPYLDSSYWMRFENWCNEHDIVVDHKMGTVTFESPEHKTMFLLTYPPL